MYLGIRAMASECATGAEIHPHRASARRTAYHAKEVVMKP
jgi:hypothetical protein